MRSAGWEPARGTLTEADSMMRLLTREMEFYASILHENWARFIFFNPEARSFYAHWDRAARESVAILRSEAGRSPHDRDLSDLVGELATQSEEFRGLWAAHNVRLHTKGVKRFNHPIVGELELSFNRLEVAADPGLMTVAYTAEPGSRSAETFALLASWSATDDGSGLSADNAAHQVDRETR